MMDAEKVTTSENKNQSWLSASQVLGNKQIFAVGLNIEVTS